MLSVKLLPSNSEILKLKYLEEGNFEELLIVCPSPEKADGIRSYIQLEGKEAEVVTISRFMKDCLSTLGEDAPVISRKSELLLKLSTIWKIKNPDVSYDIFTKAFNLYTELRGFSLNLEMLEEVLEQEEESLATAIRFFWLVSQELELMDEHQSYSILNEEFRSGESPTHELINGKSIVFMGFKHLSGGQLDMLKAVGIRANVIIPIHEDIFHSAEGNSWIGWLDVKDKRELIANEKTNLNVYRFKPGRFSEDSQTQFNKLMEEGFDPYFPSANKDFQNLNILPSEKIFYKAAIDPFKPILNSLINEFKLATDFGKKEIGIEEIDKICEEIESLSSKKDYFFRWLKVKSLFLKLLNEWRELSEVNQSLTYFDVEVFNEILDLDLPRNYLIPLFDEAPEIFIHSLDSAELNRNSKVVLIGGGFLGKLKGGDSNFSETQLDNLTTLGPIRSSELDFLTKKVAFRDLVKSTNVELILEEKLEESDIAWLELLDGYELHNISAKGNPVSRKNIFDEKELSTKTKPEKLSATALQSYLDCPKKYYYKYIENKKLEPRIEESLRPFQLGLIEHEVIGRYCEEGGELKSIAINEINKVLAKDKVQITQIQYQEALYEVLLLSQRGIDFIEGITQIMSIKSPEFEFKFKENIEGILHRGSIDYYGPSSEGTIIVDFKRSGSGIPTAGDFKAFKKIQAWYYYNHGQVDESRIALFGYFNLKDPSKSRLYSPDKALAKTLNSALKGIDPKIQHLSDLEDMFATYIDKEKELVEKLVNDSEFKASPIDGDACKYCSVSYVCERGSVEH